MGERRLAAIMFTDIVGYTSLTEKNESLSLQLLEEQKRVVRPIIAKHNGREVKTMGDAFLVEFASALEAVRCAREIQQTMHEVNSRREDDKKTLLRIGIHLGDVVHDRGDVYGEAVNLASRVEPLASPGGICVTEEVYRQVRNRSELTLSSMGRRELKNVSEPVEVFSVMASWEASSTEGRPLDGSRIAILPFASFSSDPDDSFFADGITDEIITTVAGISGLSVISRTSVMGYKGTTKKVGEIGRELNVGSILEGSFKKAGNRIRVTTQLIDVAADRHLWAQNYDRNLDDVFEVQGDIAKQVAEALRVRILSAEKERIERKPTESTVAYTLYLKGRSLWNTRRLEDLKKASEYFELAVHEDPDFALGFAGQADCALLLRNNWGLDQDANLEKARSLAAKALELDPKLGETHATIGLVHATDFHFGLAEEEFKKAIALEPSYAPAHMWYHQVLLAELRWEDALKEIERTVELDPLSSVATLNLGYYYFARREFPRSLELFKRSRELGSQMVQGLIGATYGLMGMFEDMRRENVTYNAAMKSQYPRVEVGTSAFEAYLQGDKDTVRRLLPELESVFGEAALACYNIACFHFFLGEKDKGFEWLDRSFAGREFNLENAQSDSDLDGVRSDPRYADLMQRLGLGQAPRQE